MARLLDTLAPSGVAPDGSVVVRLSREDYEASWAAGIARMMENLNKNDAPDYQRGHNIPEHLAQPLAVMCEVAVARHLGVPWDWDAAVWAAKDHNRFRNNADVGSNIEVRRVKYPNGPVSLRSNQVGKGLTLFVAYAMPPEYLAIKILGARPYDDAWNDAQPAVYGGVTSTTKRSLAQDRLWKCPCAYMRTPDGSHPQWSASRENAS